jgi:hypothetical protein
MKTEEKINENEINTDSKKKESTEEKKEKKENEINTDSKKKELNEEKKEKKENTIDTLFNNFFDDFFEFPLRLSNQLKDLSIRQKFEEEKRIPVTNLDEFFKMCEKKYNKYDDIPVTNIREFFELCEKTPIKSEEPIKKQNKKPFKEFSKSYISTTIYKNGHRIDETKQIIRNENGEEEIIKEKLIDGKGKKTISKNGKNKVIHEKKLLPDVTFSQRLPIHNIFNEYGLFDMKPRKAYNPFGRRFLPMGLLF